MRRATPPTQTAAQLAGLTRHRYELVQESTQRKKKLTSICDEVFPEFATLFKDPNHQVALAIREKFPTPQAITTASMSALRELRIGRHPSDVKLQELQRLASQSIGTKDPARLRGLIFESNQLITELKLIQQHLQQLGTEIESIVERSREGQILISMGIGPISAATIIAAIGHIANFSKPSELRSYFGWAPVEDQTGISRDRVSLTPRGSRIMKRTIYLTVWQLLRHHNSEWAKLYERLVPKMCRYDERMQAYVGRGKAPGSLAN